jgi:beta-galactosidase/beta-glucuronidase
MPPTPVRNVRIPDDLWEKLGKLALKRKTSITALLIEGANLLLATTKKNKANAETSTQTALVTDEVLKRLEAVNADIKALTARINDIETTLQTQVQTEVHKKLTTVEERIQALELSVHKTVHTKVHKPSLQKTVQVEVQTTGKTPEGLTLTQGQLAKRLQLSDKAVQKARDKGATYFAQWSASHDPDAFSWAWIGTGGRGHPMRYIPKG